jgi:hypothetical protein
MRDKKLKNSDLEAEPETSKQPTGFKRDLINCLSVGTERCYEAEQL